MKISTRKIIALVLCISLVLSFGGVAFASGDSVSISFKVGSDKMNVNGSTISAEKSFRDGNYTLVPLRAILEAFGAEVNWKGSGKIELVYRDTTIEMTVGDKKCTVNGNEKELPVAPVITNGSTMVPTRFIAENFGANVNYEASSDTINILLADDGAVTDFSKITGEISKAKIGNSYFGWSISIPKGSQLDSNSLTSNEISVENVEKNMSLDISVETGNGKTLQNYYDNIINNPKGYGISKLIDSSINSSFSPNYAEFVYSGYSSGKIKRIFITNGYIYDVTLTLDSVTNADKLKSDTFGKGILDTFTVGYKGGDSQIQDFSKVVDGYVKYENDEFGYSINSLPEWKISSDSTVNTSAFDGISEMSSALKQSLSIKVEKIDSNDTLNNYLNKVKTDYSQNFNTKYYNFIDMVSDKDFNKLVYSLTLGNEKFITEENYIKDGNLVYDISISVLDSQYSSVKDKFSKIIDSFKFSKDKHDYIVTALGEKNDFTSSEASRVGKDDSPTLCENKTAKWQVKIPGYWMQLSSSNDEAAQMFVNPKAFSMIGVISVKNDDTNRSQTDEVKFDLATIGEQFKYINKETANEKGKQVRVYNYSVVDASNTSYGTCKLYIVDGNNYSYCFLTMVLDLFASDKNLKEINDAWDSFNPMG